MLNLLKEVIVLAPPVVRTSLRVGVPGQTGTQPEPESNERSEAVQKTDPLSM